MDSSSFIFNVEVIFTEAVSPEVVQEKNWHNINLIVFIVKKKHFPYLNFSFLYWFFLSGNLIVFHS